MGDPRPPLIAGGRVLGAFGYTSSGADGWTVVGRRDLDGLSEDAIDEGRGLVERVPWWSAPDRAITISADVHDRPRRLAWLGRGNTPRRFLIHTIHAGRDASSRPGNNFSECVVVARPPVTGEAPELLGADPSGAVQVSLRPSQLWAPSTWCTPWGAAQVTAARPGSVAMRPALTDDDVVDRISGTPGGRERLLLMHRTIHDAAHLGRRPVVGRIDDVVWGAVLLDMAMRLLPAEDAWALTFDIRSIAPAPRLGHLAIQPLADVTLLGPEWPVMPPRGDVVDLTEGGVTEARRAGTAPPRATCPVCEMWFGSIQAELARPGTIDAARVSEVLAMLSAGRRRARDLDPMAGARAGRPAGRRDTPPHLGSGHLGHQRTASPDAGPAREPETVQTGERGPEEDPRVAEMASLVDELKRRVDELRNSRRSDVGRAWVEIEDLLAAGQSLIRRPTVDVGVGNRPPALDRKGN